MKSTLFVCLCVFIIAIGFGKTKAPNDFAQTPSYDQRVRLLKYQIAEEIRGIQESPIIAPGFPQQSREEDNYQYVEPRVEEPITPVMHLRKKYFLLGELKTTIEANTTKSISKKRHRPKTTGSEERRVKPPVDLFYRRLINDESLYVPMKWLHCQDLVTPFYRGYKKELVKPKALKPNDIIVRRVIHLFKINTTGHSKEEIYSVLLQISKVHIRLFQWETSAVTYLIDTLTEGRAHTLRNIMRGVRHLLKKWHLDIGNTTSLLKQAKIFRPPCMKISEYGGSTKTSAALSFKKFTSPKSSCAPTDGNDCTNPPNY